MTPRTPTSRRTAGEVVAVNTSPGGIPKLGCGQVRVLHRGLQGDGHNHAKHDTPLQAVSVIDLEDLESLAREGFAVGPGATGENVTVRGLNVDGLGPGDRLRFAGGVVLEMTKQRRPCYVLDAIDPQLQDAIAGRCGIYTRVLTEGLISDGESIIVEPAPPRWSHTAAILTGGRSRRMGTAKESLVLPDGRRMLDAVAHTARLVADRLIIAGTGGRLRGVEHVNDNRPDAGPLAGIESLLQSGFDTDWLVIPCDMPDLNAESLTPLLAGPPCGAVRLQVEGEARPRPLPARFDVSAASALSTYLDEGGRAVGGFLDRINARTVTLPASAHATLRNVNEPRDLDAAPPGSRTADPDQPAQGGATTAR